MENLATKIVTALNTGVRNAFHALGIMDTVKDQLVNHMERQVRIVEEVLEKELHPEIVGTLEELYSRPEDVVIHADHVEVLPMPTVEWSTILENRIMIRASDWEEERGYDISVKEFSGVRALCSLLKIPMREVQL